MTDLHARFRSLDHVPAPDLWDEVTRRAERSITTEPLRRVAVGRTPVSWLGIAILVAALLVAGLIGGALVAGALRNQSTPPVQPSPAGLRSPAPLASLAVPASNGVIAVAANPQNVAGGEDGDIYLVSAGTAAERIVGLDGDGIAQECPAFSPDGSRLAYGEAQASLRPITDPQGPWPVAGRAVVVVGVTGQGRVPRGSDPNSASLVPVRVTLPTDPGEIPCPEWSPDSRAVAFRLGSELWVADALSGETTVFQVNQAPFGEQGFAWSRDGALIAVAEPGQIRLVRVVGGTAQLIPVVGGAGATPRSLGWTAADQAIVYVGAHPPGTGLSLNVVDVTTKRDTELLPKSTELRNPAVNIAVSPDGSRVAYVQCPNGTCGLGEPFDQLVMDPDGSNKVTLPNPPGFGAAGLLWSPDGTRLLLGSSAGLVSVAAGNGPAPIIYSSGALNLQSSGAELTWQPVFHLHVPAVSPAPTTSAISSPRAFPQDGPLDVYPTGRFIIAAPENDDGEPVQVVATVPTGWTLFEPARGGGVAKVVGFDETVRVTLGRLGPLECGATSTSSPADQTVDELTASLAVIPGIVVTDLVIDGYPGKRVEFTQPTDNATCRWPTSSAGWHQQLLIFDINGIGFAIHAAYAPGTTASDQAQLLAIVDSIELQ